MLVSLRSFVLIVIVVRSNSVIPGRGQSGYWVKNAGLSGARAHPGTIP
jgi:hypothetical protein